MADAAPLHRARAALDRLEPGSKRSGVIDFFDAVFGFQHEKARAMLPGLRAAGVSAKSVAHLEKELDEVEPAFDRYVEPHLGQAGIALLVWAGGIALLLLVGFVLSSLALASARRVPAAGRVGTRPVDTVYLTPTTELAVTERGGMLDQIRGGRERCLVLGIGVLAHEYGHLVNEDTAGGGFALAVRRSLSAMEVGLAQAGGATWYSPAWWFLNGFHRAFMRISQGASRLQEILAERFAAFAYGSRSFEAGLSNVIEQSVRFDAHVSSTLGEVVEQVRPLPNLYRYTPERQPSEDEIRAAIDEHMESAPSPYDSHLRAADRIAWVRAIDAPDRASEADRAASAWTLFEDREASPAAAEPSRRFFSARSGRSRVWRPSSTG